MNDPLDAPPERRRSFKWIIVAVLAVAAVTFVVGPGRNLIYAALAETPPGDSLSVQDAHARAISGGIILVDIRRPDEWASTGSGEGAHRLDMRRDDFIAALDEIAGGDRAAPIALICARGVRSSRMANRLAEAGFTQIIDVPEGMLGSRAGPGWLASGLPVVEG